MYVCLCKGITDGQIKAAVEQGAGSMKEVCSQLGVATQCGKCGNHAKQVFKQTINQVTLRAHTPSKRG